MDTFLHFLLLLSSTSYLFLHFPWELGLDNKVTFIIHNTSIGFGYTIRVRRGFFFLFLFLPSYSPIRMGGISF